MRFIMVFVFFSALNVNAQLKFEFPVPINDIYIERPKINVFDTFYRDSFIIVFYIEDYKGKSQVNIFLDTNEYASVNYKNGEFLLVEDYNVMDIETGKEYIEYYEHYKPIITSYTIDNKTIKINLEKSKYKKYIY